MGYTLRAQTLRSENQSYAGTGGISANNRSLGFQPGYYNAESGEMAISCFADGRLAPIHVLEGVPADWVTARNAGGGVLSVKDSVVSGFIHGGCFYTRAQAADLAARIGRFQYASSP